MKKITIIASALLMFGLTSCKKDYTCTCNTVTSATSSDPDYAKLLPKDQTSSTTFTGNMKKKDSEAWCSANEGEASSTSNLGTITITSTVKTTCSL